MADGDVEHGEAKFNMGIATLERIHTSLEKIRWIFTNLSGIHRQALHINEVKILYMNVAPLLIPILKTEKEKKNKDGTQKEDLVKKYNEEIDGLKMKSKIFKGRQVTYYSSQLETRLFQIVREWELHLEKYFMPKKSDFAGL